MKEGKHKQEHARINRKNNISQNRLTTATTHDNIAFIGAAGRTRDDLSSQRRPKEHKTARKRNTKR